MRLLLLLLIFPFAQLAFAGEKSLYDFIWLDPDKKVYVLQNKLFKKEHSVYFDLGYLSNQTSKFQDTRGFQGTAGWYFHEEWGVEVFYNHYNNASNEDYRNVRVLNGQVPFVRRPLNTIGALLIWSPFYGKINTFNNIYYFDWSFAAGPAAVSTESNLKTAIIPGTTSVRYNSESYTGAVLKTTVKFHIREDLHVGLGYMNTYFQAPSPKSPKSDKLRDNTDVVLSVGVSL